MNTLPIESEQLRLRTSVNTNNKCATTLGGRVRTRPNPFSFGAIVWFVNIIDTSRGSGAKC